MLALERANEVKAVKAYWRKRVRAAPRRESILLAADLVEDTPGPLGSTMVWEVLGWVRRLGRTKPTEVIAERMLDEAGVSQFRKLGDLTPRQRSALAEVLRRAA